MRDKSPRNVIVFPQNKKISSPTTSSEDKSKLERFAEELSKGLVMVTLDARQEGVVVPPDFKQNPMLHLNFSLMYRLPELVYDEEGIIATLEFPKGQFRCEIPWKSVYGLHPEFSKNTLWWRSSIPKDIVDSFPSAKKQEGSPLRLVKDEE